MGQYKQRLLLKDEIADEFAGRGAKKTPVGLESIIEATQQHVKATIRGNVIIQEYFSQMERVGGESQAITGLHRGPRSRTHQVIPWSGEKQEEVGCKPADWAEYPGMHLTLISAVENDMCRKCDLGAGIIPFPM